MIEVTVRKDGTVDIHCDAKTAGVLAGRGRKWWRHDLRLEAAQNNLGDKIALAWYAADCPPAHAEATALLAHEVQVVGGWPVQP